MELESDAMDTDAPPAGWYPQADNPDQQGWWTGTAWSGHMRSSQNAVRASVEATPRGTDDEEGAETVSPPVCGECGNPSAMEDAFCGECGNALAEPAAQRSQVAVNTRREAFRRLSPAALVGIASLTVVVIGAAVFGLNALRSDPSNSDVSSASAPDAAVPLTPKEQCVEQLLASQEDVRSKYFGLVGQVFPNDVFIETLDAHPMPSGAIINSYGVGLTDIIVAALYSEAPLNARELSVSC